MRHRLSKGRPHAAEYLLQCCGIVWRDPKAGARRVRLHHHRRRLRRLRACQPPQRRPRGQGAAARGRPTRLASLHPHAGGPGQACPPEAHQLGLQHRPRAAAQPPCAVVATRQGAGRIKFDQRDVLHPRGRPRLRRLGRAWRATAGIGTPCCRTSSAAKATRAAAMRCMAATARSRCPTCATSIRCRWPSSKPGNRPGSPATTTSTACAQQGVGLYQVTQKDGARCSAAVAYLNPVKSRPNLTIHTGALVSRVTFERRRRATRAPMA